jgi:hypothetical protein
MPRSGGQGGPFCARWRGGRCEGSCSSPPATLADQHSVRTSLRAHFYLAARRLAGGMSAAPRHVGLTEFSLNEAAAGSCTECSKLGSESGWCGPDSEGEPMRPDLSDLSLR